MKSLGHDFDDISGKCVYCGCSAGSLTGMEMCPVKMQEHVVQATTKTTDQPKKEKPKSRPERWSEACSRAESASCDLRAALDELQSMREEYGEWRDNLPENLQGSALGEKLNTVADLDVDNALASLDEVDSTVDECASADLPRGFGRD